MPEIDQPLRDAFDIERQIYNTQWTNIRHHWDQTFASVRYLSTLIPLAVLSLKFLRVSENEQVQIAGDPTVGAYVKAFALVAILLIGIVTFLSQYNHYRRSQEARRVVVEIERRWGLYDENENFIFQKPDSNYAYGKFPGGEKRLSHAQVQFGYIVVVTLIGAMFVLFA